MKTTNHQLLLGVCIAIFLPAIAFGSPVDEVEMTTVTETPETSTDINTTEENEEMFPQFRDNMRCATNSSLLLKNEDNTFLWHKMYTKMENNMCDTIDDCFDDGNCDAFSKYDDEPMKMRCNANKCECHLINPTRNMECFPKTIERPDKHYDFAYLLAEVTINHKENDVSCQTVRKVDATRKFGVFFKPEGESIPFCTSASNCPEYMCETVAQTYQVDRKNLETVCILENNLGMCGCSLRRGYRCPLKNDDNSH